MSAEPSIYLAMSAVMKDIGAVEKGSRNEHFDYAFRGIDDVLNAVNKALVTNRVFYAPLVIHKEYSVVGKQRHALVDVVYTFYGPAGDSVEVGPYTGEGLDTSDKATNKALTAALKYMLLHTFCIPTEEQKRDDADAHSPQWDTSEAKQSVGTDQVPKPPEPASSDGGSPQPKGGPGLGEGAGPPQGGDLKTLLHRYGAAKVLRSARTVALNSPDEFVPTDSKSLERVSAKVLAQVARELGGDGQGTL